MSRRPFAAVLIAPVAFALLTGCGLLGSTSDDKSPTPDGNAAAQPTGSARSGLGDSVKDAGTIPDPCTLLSQAEVTKLTGRDITQVDQDGAEPGEAARFCQWQQSGGQLAVFLSRTTPADYELTIEEATPVDGLGEKAFQLAGHLYVLYGTVQVDVYSRGDSDTENMTKARDVVNVLLPKI